MEKFLYRLDETLMGDTDYVIQLEIVDTGTWIVKFRRYGFIINNM